MTEKGRQRYVGTVMFQDADLHGLMHNSRYVAYAEAAVDEALRGTFVDQMNSEDCPFVLLVAQIHVEFKAPLRYREPYAIAVTLEEVGGASLRFAARFTSRKSEVATVLLVWVNARKDSGKSVKLSGDEIAEIEKALGSSHDSQSE